MPRTFQTIQKADTTLMHSWPDWMKKLNEIDWFFIIGVIGFAALAVSAAYAIGKIITEVIRWGF